MIRDIDVPTKLKYSKVVLPRTWRGIMKITTPIIIGILIMLPVVALAGSVAPPPQPLHLQGDHWTPYDPPAEFPEGSTIHVVVKGDTLWDLAAQYLEDPYLWPQIWEQNPYIQDSHWIYPGDPIVINLAVEEPEPEVEPVVEEIEPEPEPVGNAEPMEPVDERVPYPLGDSADVYCFARIFKDESIFAMKISSAENMESKSQLSEGDVVYLNGGSAQGVQAGDRFFIFHRQQEVLHPISGGDMGRLFQQVGQLKILCAQENTSIAKIGLACNPISIGDVLLPFRPIPVPLVLEPETTERCDPPNGNPTGYIVYNRENVVGSMTGMPVMIDLSEAEGVYPGQFGTIFRDNPVEGMPRLVVGEIGVLTVEDGYSTALITRCSSPIGVGDRIELK